MKFEIVRKENIDRKSIIEVEANNEKEALEKGKYSGRVLNEKDVLTYQDVFYLQPTTFEGKIERGEFTEYNLHNVTAVCSITATLHETIFNCSDYLKKAPKEEILGLSRNLWKEIHSGLESCGVVLHFSESATRNILQLLHCISENEGYSYGCSCSINEKEALRWLEDQRPNVFVEIMRKMEGEHPEDYIEANYFTAGGKWLGSLNAVDLLSNESKDFIWEMSKDNWQRHYKSSEEMFSSNWLCRLEQVPSIEVKTEVDVIIRKQQALEWIKYYRPTIFRKIIEEDPSNSINVWKTEVGKGNTTYGYNEWITNRVLPEG